MSTVRDIACRGCGHVYGWRGGISFEAVCELGRLIREHDEREHPDVATPAARTRPPTSSTTEEAL